jgi:signal transduction histidine kinase
MTFLRCPDAQTLQPLPRTVLVLDQSGPSALNPGYSNVFTNFRTAVLARAPASITIYLEKLDLDHFAGQRQLGNLRRYLEKKYREIPIGVLVAIGSAALDFSLQHRSEFGPDIPIVVVAADDESVARTMHASGARNVTGRTLQFSLRHSLDAARILVPGLKSIALVGDPLDRQTFRHHFRQEVQTVSAEVNLIDLTGWPMAELRKRVSALPKDSAIMYTAITLGDAGVTYLPNEGLEAFADAANRPIVIDVDNRIGHGATGGWAVMPSLMGREAAQLVLRIFQGEDVSRMPIAASEASGMVFDWRQLQRWGITEAQLPPGSDVRFRTPTVWDQYRVQILACIAVVLLQAALSWWLICEHRRRNRAEIAARNAMSELMHSNRMATAGELSASIAHEISQPLTGIVARASAALRWISAETPDTDKIRNALLQIVSAGHRASEIITSVRAMFKKDSTQRSPVNINRLIATVLRIVQADLQNHQVTVLTQFGDQLAWISANQVQLEQVLLNLVMNAVESMNATQPRILRLKTAPADNGGVHVSVEDSGSGVDPADLHRLFKPMFTTKERGMGMGLSICHSIIDNHDGRIWVTAAPVRGSIFHFTIPGNGNSR